MSPRDLRLPRFPTRTPEECRALAVRQRAGEHLGLTDRFVEDWAGAPAQEAAPPDEAAPAPKKSASTRAEAEVPAAGERAAAREKKQSSAPKKRARKRPAPAEKTDGVRAEGAAEQRPTAS